MSLSMMLLLLAGIRIRAHHDASVIIFLIHLLLIMQGSCWISNSDSTPDRADVLQLRSILSSGNDSALGSRCFSVTQRSGSRKLSRLRRTAQEQANQGSNSRVDPVSSIGQLTTAYYMQTKIGTPPKEVLLLVDTASELTWVQGSSCKNCSPTKVPPFDPTQSSSFITESCSSSVCSNRNNSGFQSACDRSTDSCSFQVSYLDGSEAYGVVAREIFSLESWSGAGSKLGSVVFGCATKDIQRPIDFSSGTLGLNRGRFSFPAQLGKNGISGRFSYCFPNRAEHLNSSGVIIFGDFNIPEHHFRYIPLEQDPPVPGIIDFYYVDLQGISVGDDLLQIPSPAFKIDKLGNGGTYFDSGTTVSFLVEPAHTALVEAFGRRVTHLNRTSGSDFTNELCYDVAATAAAAVVLPRAPLVTLHFKNDVKMELREPSLWVPLARTAEVVTLCLAFVNAGPISQGGVNVIGNYQQQDYLIEHDLGGSRIGFAPANCVMD